ncbi:MAG: ribosome silencing factor [Treponema sp.]|nr:ribosome silencing factor [Treponema sp.]
MEDTLPVIDKKSQSGIDQSATVNEIAELMQEHKGQNVSVLDLRNINGWTDFFVVVTVTSNTHMEGLVRHLKDFCNENEIMIFGSSRKNQDDQWHLIDLGSIVIHLMTSAAREFYELERLWAHNKKT